MQANVAFDFNPQIDSKAKLEKFVTQAYQANKKFFNKDSSPIKIVFLYERSQMDKVCGRKTPDWLVGHALPRGKVNKIAIFSPTAFEEVSSHPASDFLYTLIHEIAHVFIKDVLDFYYPQWFYEGVAGYIAQQYKNRLVKRIHDFKKLHDIKGWQRLNNYDQAFSFTKHLMDRLGEKKMLRFLIQLPKILGRRHRYQEFVEFFNQFFRVDFDGLVVGWRKCFENSSLIL